MSIILYHQLYFAVTVADKVEPKMDGKGWRKRKGVCKFWLTGSCKKSEEDCLYSHSGTVEKLGEKCKFYTNGHPCAFGSACRYMHETYPCAKFFIERCDESDCKFSHASLDDRSRSLVKQVMLYIFELF